MSLSFKCFPQILQKNYKKSMKKSILKTSFIESKNIAHVLQEWILKIFVLDTKIKTFERNTTLLNQCAFKILVYPLFDLKSPKMGNFVALIRICESTIEGICIYRFTPKITPKNENIITTKLVLLTFKLLLNFPCIF